MSNLSDRIKRLEKQATPARRIYVLYPGEVLPAEAGPDDVVIRVVYVEGPRDK